MNIAQAKQINLPELMTKLGYKPISVKKGGNEYWCQSPFRKESDPSFHTSFLGGKWIWNDFGDTGGTVIDFIIRHENLSSVKETLKHLEGLYGQNHSQSSLFRSSSPQKPLEAKENSQTPFSFQQQGRKGLDAENELELIKVGPVQNPSIFSYLENERCIGRSLVKKYFEQIWYKHKPSGRTYFAFGMKNRSNGYEIRIASDEYSFTKSSIGEKDITIIPGLEPRKSKVNIFEGMIDFLSLVTMYGSERLKGDSIILNTTQNAKKAITYMQDQSYEGVNTFLDNDTPGQKCLDTFKEILGKDSVSSQNQLYAGYGDVNDCLRANQSPCFIPR